jgi:hypothetical protein
MAWFSSPRTFTVAAWVNGAWTEVLTQTDVTDWTKAAKTFPLTNLVDSARYRLIVRRIGAFDDDPFFLQTLCGLSEFLLFSNDKIREIYTRLDALAPEPVVVLPITVDNIVNATNAVELAPRLFDSPEDPFFDGTSGDARYSFNWIGTAELVLNLDAPTQLTEFLFYKSLDLIVRFPRLWTIYSSDTATGPWTEQASVNDTGDAPTAPIELSIPVDFTAQYVRVYFANTYTSGSAVSINECIVKGRPAPPDVRLLSQGVTTLDTALGAIPQSWRDGTGAGINNVYDFLLDLQTRVCRRA